MPGDLPTLNKRQIDRLVEIAMRPNTGRTDIKPVSTEHLLCEGCLVFRRTIKDDLREVALSPLGIRILAGLPGDEFARFRVMMRPAHAC